VNLGVVIEAFGVTSKGSQDAAGSLVPIRELFAHGEGAPKHRFTPEFGYVLAESLGFVERSGRGGRDLMLAKQIFEAITP
jgi:hypothetical protein